MNDSLPSRRTVRALQALLAGYDPAQVALTIVDLSKQPAHQAGVEMV